MGSTNLMVGHWCPIIHRLNPKARFNVKNDELKVIKATLSLSQHLVYVLMFEVAVVIAVVFFWKKKIISPNHLQQQNESLRSLQFIWNTGVMP